MILSIMMQISIMSYTSLNEGFFSGMNEMVKLDYTIRYNLINFSDEFITLSEQMKYSIEWASLSPAEKTQEKEDSMKKKDFNLKKVLLTEDYLEFYIPRLESTRKEITETYKLNLISESKKNLTRGEREKLYLPTLTVRTDKNFEISMSPTDYMRHYLVRTTVAVDYMTFIRPITANKEPPFALQIGDHEKLEEYFRIYRSIMDSCFEDFFPATVQLLESIFESAIRKRETLFHRNLWLFFYITGLTCVAFCGFFLYQSQKVNRNLFKRISIVGIMKNEDLDFQKQILQNSIDLLRTNKFNEVRLIEGYLDKGNSSFPKSNNKDYSSKSKFVGSNQIKKSFGQKKVKDNLTFGLSKSIIFCNVPILLVIIAALVLSMAVGIPMLESIEIEKLYFENYQRFIPLSNNYLSFINLLVFGNFVLIDGKLAEDFKDDSSVQKFNSFLIQNQYSQYLSDENKIILNSMLFENICSVMIPDVKWKKILLDNCEAYIPAQKGLIGILIAEDEEIKSKTFQIMRDQIGFLSASRSQRVDSPNSDYFFTEKLARLRLIHNNAFQTFFNVLFNIVEGMLERTFQLTLNRMKIIQETSIALVCVLTAAYLLISFHFLVRDKKVCLESFLSISPEVIYRSSGLYRQLDRLFMSK